jgi:two-component system heavy metal sensor histidine kinase CusS
MNALEIERVVINLLSNALKFTPEGGVITLRSVWRENEIVIAVSDTGPGVSAEEAPFLFDKYRTAHAARGQESSGLGLFIVKTLVEAHRGRVEVENVPGQGACFSVILPLING